LQLKNNNLSDKKKIEGWGGKTGGTSEVGAKEWGNYYQKIIFSVIQKKDRVVSALPYAIKSDR